MFSMNRKDIPPHLLKFFEPRWTRKPKDDLMIPHRVFDALMNDGWYGRGDIVWHKPNPMPSSVTDRPTSAHEYVFLLARSERYWYDADAVREPNTPDMVRRAALGHTRGKNGKTDASRNDADTLRGEHAMEITASGRNRRSVWTVPTEPKPFAHFAMFPQALIEPMVLAGCPAQVCAVCGAPYERVVEVERSNYRTFDHPHRTGGAMSGGVGKNFPDTVRRDLGFEPTCSCAADTRPGIVFDPFMGSGTVALVAMRLGRHFIGTDINHEYVKMARERIAYRGDDRTMIREQEAGVKQLNLFGAACA